MTNNLAEQIADHETRGLACLWPSAWKIICQQQALLKEAAKSLAFYANKDNYVIDVNYSAVEINDGELAQQALQKLKDGGFNDYKPTNFVSI